MRRQRGCEGAIVSFKWRLRSGDREGGGDVHRETEGSVFGQFGRQGCVQRIFATDLDVYKEGMWKKQVGMWH